MCRSSFANVGCSLFFFSPPEVLCSCTTAVIPIVHNSTIVGIKLAWIKIYVNMSQLVCRMLRHDIKSQHLNRQGFRFFGFNQKCEKNLISGFGATEYRWAYGQLAWCSEISVYFTNDIGKIERRNLSGDTSCSLYFFSGLQRFWSIFDLSENYWLFEVVSKVFWPGKIFYNWYLR